MKYKIPSTKTLDLTEEEKTKVADWCEKIKKEVPFVDKKPFSHNIIGLCLLQISEITGKNYVNKLIDHFGLIRLGWAKEPEDE